ncbi:MAG: hypothetical protein Q9190_001053 [Brigantiaea leucoxantha]
MALYAGALALTATDVTVGDLCRRFRLLSLSPGSISDELRGELFVASMDDVNIHYTAVSYRWENSDNPGYIVLNYGYTLPVTRNLEEALRQFRQRSEPIWLWVDAICINQADDEEKSSQVGIMRDIYASADQTWVWIGAADTESNAAMDAVQEFWHKNYSTDELTLITQKVWDGVGGLMRRSWWTRVWVIQEVLVSKRVHVWCGAKRINFECFVKLEQIRRDFAFRFLPTQPFGNILSNWTLNQEIVVNGGCPLFEWMADTHKFESTLRRDRIYALLGLSSEDSRGAIVPDYSKRTSDSLLSVQTTAHFLMQQKRLLPLQSGFYRKAADLDLPSWVSDWSTSQAGNVQLVFESPYNACGRFKTASPRFLPDIKHPSFCSEHTALILRGVVVGEIQKVEPMPEVPLYIGNSAEDNLKSRIRRREVTRSTCSRWKETYESSFISLERSSIAKTHFQRYDSREKLHEAFWRTVIVNRLLDGTGPPGSEYGRHFTDWLDGIDSEGAVHFRNAAVSHCAGRSFITDEQNFPGLAPKTTKVGEYICLLHGGDVPFVLRPLPPGSERYEFVGEAYMSYHMQGESSDRLGGTDLRNFEIH